MEIGLYTFGDRIADPRTGRRIPARDRLDEVLAAAELADRLGLAVFAVGEHHRPEFAISTPAVVLAAIAQRTRRIRLSSAVSVLSSTDPVRLFEEFATVDLLSGGRAEIMAGRGAFVESFPLFGYALEDYEELFDEHLDLLLTLRRQDPVRWSGRHRPALHDLPVAPRPLQDPLPVWLGVGGTPSSAVRAGRLGLPMALGLIGGELARFAPLADTYRRAAQAAGHAPDDTAVAITAHCFVAETATEARDRFHPYYAAYLGEISRTRGQRWDVSRADMDQMAAPPGVLVVGSPDEVVAKLTLQHELFGSVRFVAQHDVGGLPWADVARSVELLATEVAPRVAHLGPG